MDEVGGYIGYAPQVTIAPARPDERALYRALWEQDAYRTISPGEECVVEFLSRAAPSRGASVADLGCGTGRAGQRLSLMAGLDVTMLDFAYNCLDEAVKESLSDTLRFVEADLTKQLPICTLFGFCADTMEHIPPEQVDDALDNILRSCQHVFFRISTTNDVCGKLVGHPLHLSIHDYSWWRKQFEARECKFHWSRNDNDACLFYVSAWTDGQSIVDVGVLNIEEDQILANVAHNIRQGWMQVTPHVTNDWIAMIIGGGPSLALFEKEIIRKRKRGVKLITLNGAYNWCLDRGLVPSAQIVVDARAFNSRFTHPVVDECKYLIASQCDQSVLDGLPIDRTYLWHTTAEQISDILNEQYPAWYGVPGGSTVLLRAIPLLRMLGYSKFHLYGCDSCLMGDSHHAFQQTENDSPIIIPVEVGGRIFYCHPWMAAQATEFITLISVLGNEINLAVHGDGLLAHILNTGAAKYDEQGV